MAMIPRVFIGWDASQMMAYTIAQRSLEQHAADAVRVERIAMPALVAQGLYTRPTRETDHGYWDEISDAPMSTGHAIARFLVPSLCNYEGWAVFTDGDVLFRKDIAALFAFADASKAVQVVQHPPMPHALTKMSGEAQTAYARKNWSSVILWHCAHPFNRALTPAMVNALPGRMLHRFCWLEDDVIGALPPAWNVLVGEQTHSDPAIAHFTLGTPNLSQRYSQQPYADEWWAVARSAKYRQEVSA